MFYSNGLKNFYLSAGIGIAEYALESFDKALLNAEVGDYNLIKLSSILPPACKFVEEWEELPWPKGSLIPVAYASHTWEINRLAISKSTVYASVSVAIPENPYENGLIMESSGVKEKQYESYTMAVNGMKNRDRMVKEILTKHIEYTFPDYESQLSNYKHVTLFACCVLG